MSISESLTTVGLGCEDEIGTTQPQISFIFIFFIFFFSFYIFFSLFSLFIIPKLFSLFSLFFYFFFPFSVFSFRFPFRYAKSKASKKKPK